MTNWQEPHECEVFSHNINNTFFSTMFGPTCPLGTVRYDAAELVATARVGDDGQRVVSTRDASQTWRSVVEWMAQQDALARIVRDQVAATTAPPPSVDDAAAVGDDDDGQRGSGDEDDGDEYDSDGSDGDFDFGDDDDGLEWMDDAEAKEKARIDALFDAAVAKRLHR
jgi:hypothetical protein